MGSRVASGALLLIAAAAFAGWMPVTGPVGAPYTVNGEDAGVFVVSTNLEVRLMLCPPDGGSCVTAPGVVPLVGTNFRGGAYQADAGKSDLTARRLVESTGSSLRSGPFAGGTRFPALTQEQRTTADPAAAGTDAHSASRRHHHKCCLLLAEPPRATVHAMPASTSLGLAPPPWLRRTACQSDGPAAALASYAGELSLAMGRHASSTCAR